MPLCASTGPVLGRCCQHRPSTGPVLATNGMYTGNILNFSIFDEGQISCLLLGNDPATDLRGSGFLGLMHLLYMVTEPSLFGLAKDIYCLSLHETQVRRLTGKNTVKS